MDYTIIQFPFSSINDESYMLAICLNAGGTLAVSTANTALTNDSCFKFVKTKTTGGNTFYVYEGSLCGNVVAEDDERSDFYEPLVSSKLRFSIAVQNVPSWLMQFAGAYQAKVVVYRDRSTDVELWRGYLMAQTLNMTTVDDRLVCNLVALDDVGMAKHINFKNSLSVLGVTSHNSTLYSLFAMYYGIHQTYGITSSSASFAGVYSYFGLGTSGKMLWWRDLALRNESSNEIKDVLKALYVNYDRWLLEDGATWEDVLDPICRYLGVTFSVGNWGSVSHCDGYILANPTGSNTTGYIYTMSTATSGTTSSNPFASFSNPSKFGGDFQVTVNPAEYRKVTVKSEPERWESHEYLTEDHYKPVLEGSGVTLRFGTSEDTSEGFTAIKYHKLAYIEPDDDESDYLTIHPCAKGEGYTMASNGELPYDSLSSCNGITKPGITNANSLDFVTFMEGTICVRLGEFDFRGVNEDANTTPYFMLLNHMWGSKYLNGNHIMAAEHDSDTQWVSFRPIGTAEPIHPADSHYVTISMEVMFVRENFGSEIGVTQSGNIAVTDKSWLWTPASGTGSMIKVDFSNPAILMPTTNSAYTGFEDTAKPYSGRVASWTSLSFWAYLRIGEWYYNGSTWTKVTSRTPPTCRIRMWNDTTETSAININGNKSIRTKNYYFTVSSPFVGDNSAERDGRHRQLVDMTNLSSASNPIYGDLELTILGQVPFQNTAPDISGGYMNNEVDIPNSIPYILVKDVRIGFTDDAEIMDKDIENKLSEDVSDSFNLDEMTRSLELATPSVEGFFDNCLLWKGSSKYHNLTATYRLGSTAKTTPEQMLLDALSTQYAGPQTFVEFSTECKYNTKMHNVGFKITGLTEVGGTFLPVKRSFDYTLDQVRIKALARNT